MFPGKFCQDSIARGVMITRVTGTLNRVLDEEVRLQVGGLEYQGGARVRPPQLADASARR